MSKLFNFARGILVLSVSMASSGLFAGPEDVKQELIRQAKVAVVRGWDCCLNFKAMMERLAKKGFVLGEEDQQEGMTDLQKLATVLRNAIVAKQKALLRSWFTGLGRHPILNGLGFYVENPVVLKNLSKIIAGTETEEAAVAQTLELAFLTLNCLCIAEVDAYEKVGLCKQEVGLSHIDVFNKAVEMAFKSMVERLAQSSSGRPTVPPLAIDGKGGAYGLGVPPEPRDGDGDAKVLAARTPPRSPRAAVNPNSSPEEKGAEE